MSKCLEIPSEASRLVREWAGERSADDSVKALIRRAARRLGFTYRRTKALWYREAKAIRADELDTLRQREKAADEPEAPNEIEELRVRLDRLELWLAALVGERARQDSAVVDQPRGDNRRKAFG